MDADRNWELLREQLELYLGPIAHQELHKRYTLEAYQHADRLLTMQDGQTFSLKEKWREKAEPLVTLDIAKMTNNGTVLVGFALAHRSPSTWIAEIIPAPNSDMKLVMPFFYAVYRDAVEALRLFHPLEQNVIKDGDAVKYKLYITVNWSELLSSYEQQIWRDGKYLTPQSSKWVERHIRALKKQAEIGGIV